jgi:hypothetical protein
MPTQQNAFDGGYAAIMTALKSWAPLTALVKVNNFQDLSSSTYSPRVNVNAGDRVEILLAESTLQFRPFSVNSTAVDLVACYPLRVKSGMLGLSKINLVMWEVGRALTSAGPQLSLSELLKWDMNGDAQVRADDLEAKRPDWTTIAVIRLEFKISAKDYLANTYT